MAGQQRPGAIGPQNPLGDPEFTHLGDGQYLSMSYGCVPFPVMGNDSFSTYEYLKVNAGPWTFSNALSPVQASVVIAALSIVRSQEGVVRRRRLMDRVVLLRALLEAYGLRCLGEPSPIVPVLVGSEALARLVSKHLTDLGVAANLVEYPAVAMKAARFRFQVMADHTEAHVRFAAAGIAEALRRACEELGVDDGCAKPATQELP